MSLGEPPTPLPRKGDSEENRLRKVIVALEKIIKGKDLMLLAYRIGGGRAHTKADRGLTLIEGAEKKLEELGWSK